MQRPIEFREEYRDFILIARYDIDMRRTWSGYYTRRDGRAVNPAHAISNFFATGTLRFPSGHRVQAIQYNDEEDCSIVNGVSDVPEEGAARVWTAYTVLEDLKRLVDSL